MAISLTDRELAEILHPTERPVERSGVGGEWIVTDGGTTVRCDLESMNEEIADAPLDNRPAQTLQALIAFRNAAMTARSNPSTRST